MKRNRFKPRDIDISKPLLGHFGCCEFESAAIKIIRFLQDDNRKADVESWMGTQADGKGWEKPFRIHDIPIDSTMFAALCACGWISACWFPKGIFTVSKDFVERLWEKRSIRSLTSQPKSVKISS